MGKRNALDPKIVRKIRLYARVLKKAGIPVQSLIVFGSQTKGTPKPCSDIDICVISPIFGKDRIEERVELGTLADKIDWRIEPHPYSPEDFAVEEDPFAHEIKRTGVEIKA